MRILVIGGMGLIGGAITKAASERNNEVYIVSRRELFGDFLQDNVNGIQGDWRDDEFAHKVMTYNYDVIIDTQVFDRKQLVRSLNLSEGHCKQYIYISTDSVYEHPAKDLREDDEINDDNILWDYGINKLKAEQYLKTKGDNYSFFWTVVRPTITFGETRIPVGFCSKRDTFTLIERIKDNKPVIRFDDPQSRHAICHVSTFGEAVVGLFLNELARSQCFHISDDYAYTYDEIYEAIEKVIGKKGIYIYLPVDYMKKYNKSIYEEMIYDKNPYFSLNNDKIKEISFEANYHPNLYTIIEATVKHLEVNKKCDMEYDFITDSILNDYKDKILDEYDKMVVFDYLSGLNRHYIINLRKYELLKKIDNLFFPLKRKILNIAHELKKYMKDLNERKG